MDGEGKIFYSVLDLSSNQASQTAGQGQDQENDKHFWSAVDFTSEKSPPKLQFPKEIAQVGYGVVPNRLVGDYKTAKDTTNNDGEIDSFYSTTARLGAIAPFQALSDGKYIYIFRQSVAAGDDNNIAINVTTDDNGGIQLSTAPCWSIALS